MSFSGKIKEELSKHDTKARHCQIAELSAIMHLCGKFSEDRNGTCILQFHSENL